MGIEISTFFYFIEVRIGIFDAKQCWCVSLKSDLFMNLMLVQPDTAILAPFASGI